MKSDSRLVAKVMTIVFVLLACAQPAVSQADTPADANAEAGRALFMQKGCYECHGIFGQGSASTGPALAPHPIPLAAMQAYVHNPKGEMPVYSAKILSDDEIARIHAYLVSLPASPSADSVALLNDGAAATLVEALGGGQGASIYAANCAACHGARGDGGVGPSLRGIGAHYGAGDIEARIRAPSGIMPRLYPGVLSEQDVRDVARFVESLQ